MDESAHIISTEPGTGYDQLVINGTAALAGTLVVTLEDGFYRVLLKP